MYDNANTATLPEGHPVSVYYQEREIIIGLLEEITTVDSKEEFQKYTNIFNQLQTIEKRFARKENQLFPYLEKKGWNGPSQGMWSFHDNLREQFRLLRKNMDANEFDKIKTNTPFLVEGISRLLNTEDNVLFPNSLDLLTENDWIAMRKGEEEIGHDAARRAHRIPSRADEQRDRVRLPVVHRRTRARSQARSGGVPA